MTSTIIHLSQGKRIRMARESVGMEQDELAEALHVGRPTLSAWENDRNKKPVSWAHLKLIAEVTGFDLDLLVPRIVAFVPVEVPSDTTSVTHGHQSVAAAYQQERVAA